MNASDVERSFSVEPLVYRFTKLGFFAAGLPLSASMAIYILCRLLHSRQFRSSLSNQSIIALLLDAFVQITSELPITLDYLVHGYVRIHTDAFCRFWVWYNFSLQSSNLLLMSWISIERHILIFHFELLRTSRGKMIYHFLPLIVCVVYVPLFYFICVVLYPCVNSFDPTSLLCGTICYNSVTWLSTFDWLTNVLIPSLLIPGSSLVLLLRVVIQRKKMRRSLQWRPMRKLTVQLVFLSSLYLLVWLPLASVSLIRLYFASTFLDQLTFYYFNYSPYLVQLWMPFVCFACLNEIWPKNFRLIHTSPVTQN